MKKVCTATLEYNPGGELAAALADGTSCGSINAPWPREARLSTPPEERTSPILKSDNGCSGYCRAGSNDSKNLKKRSGRLRKMHVLSIHTGHGATVGLLKDGKVIACTSEERFKRQKNFMGWPELALAWVLEYANITMNDIALVVFPSTDPASHHMQMYNKAPFMEGNKPISRKNFRGRMGDVAKRRLINNSLLWRNYKMMQNMKNGIKKGKFEERIRADYARRLCIGKERIVFVDHHYAHAITTAFNLPKDRNTLVFTLDGEGDELCATVNIFDGKNMRRISATHKDHSLGWLYMHTTRFLGMKGNEHEFKVMGLAPYAKGNYVDKVYERLKNIVYLDSKDGLAFKSKFPLQFSDTYFDDHFKGTRFDNLAGGVQKLTEDLMTQWVRQGIEQTGIGDIAISGGVFMNVKANMCIAQMPEVHSIFVMPSCGDESLVFGGLWHGYEIAAKQQNAAWNPQPITNLYLGKEWTNDDIKEYIQREGIDKRYNVRHFAEIEEKVAELLAKGEVVARFNGRAEWGARALGNRSILANPSNFETVRVINEMIKNRDFWMPFTPSILDTDMKRYVLNPKNIFAPYMCITFESTKLAREHLAAAMHPYDKTLRPQDVREAWNPSYYKIIRAFKKRTGIGAVLNTSFNLHGEPNVNSPADAIHTMDNSDLRNLAMGNYLIQKQPRSRQGN